MGAGQSTASGSHLPSHALHVLRVTPTSPASQTDIEPFFDFVVGIEEDSSASKSALDAASLEKIVESHEGKLLNLRVWNSKKQGIRVVPLIPSREWTLQSPASATLNPREPDAKPSLLGLSMRMCKPEFALDHVWHVLDVVEGSPAESAGLVPYGDWVIGWSGGVLSAEGDFYELVESHADKPLRVYVYSYDFDTIREVVLVPNRQWGGDGLLGCSFGFGLLHRIPEVPLNREPGALPPELTEPADGYDEPGLFVPADNSTEELRFELDAVSHYTSPHSSYTPAIAQEYGYAYSNRGSSYLARPQNASSIPEEHEPTNNYNGQAHYEHHHHNHDHGGAHDGHDHSHHHIGDVHNHDHDHDRDHERFDDHGHDHSRDHSDEHEDEHGRQSPDLGVDHRPSASTPRPSISQSPGSRGLYHNGILSSGISGRLSLSDVALRYSGRRASSQIAFGTPSLAWNENEDDDDAGGEIEGESEAASDYGSLTSVE